MSRIVLVLFLLFVLNIASGQYPSEKPSVESGRGIFISNCSSCHGEKGDGSGLTGAYDFTDHEKLINENSTAFFKSITDGRVGTAMPAFKNNLSESQRWDVIAHIWTFWTDKVSVEKGKGIFEKNCISCHGIKGDGSGLQGAFNFTNLSTMVNEHPAAFFEGVNNGVSGTAMPSWKDALSESERWNVVKYSWTFQFKDYAIEIAGTPIPSPGITSQNNSWYSTPAGAAIILISLIMVAGILYLFRKGVDER